MKFQNIPGKSPRGKAALAADYWFPNMISWQPGQGGEGEGRERRRRPEAFTSAFAKDILDRLKVLLVEAERFLVGMKANLIITRPDIDAERNEQNADERKKWEPEAEDIFQELFLNNGFQHYALLAWLAVQISCSRSLNKTPLYITTWNATVFMESLLLRFSRRGISLPIRSLRRLSRAVIWFAWSAFRPFLWTAGG